MIQRTSPALLLPLALVLVACAGAAPTAAPTSPPTAAPTAAPTTPPTPAPTAPPTAPPTAAPTATPAPTPTGEAAFPNEYEARLLSYVLEEYRDSCMRYPPTYDTELASIECGPEDLPVDYTLFLNQADMDAAYEGDLDLGDFPSEPDGSCEEANFEDTYTIAGEIAGRVNCRQHTSSSSGSLYHVIEWTHNELVVLSYISNRADLRSWADLIDFWIEKSGPFTP